MQKFLSKFQRLATSGRHNYAMITDRPKFTVDVSYKPAFYRNVCTDRAGFSKEAILGLSYTL